MNRHFLNVFICVGLFQSYGMAQELHRVMTWNLKWFPGGKTSTQETATAHIEAFRKEVKRISPDFLILQEVATQAAIDEALKPLDSNWQTVVISNFKQGGYIAGQQIAIAAKISGDRSWVAPWEKGWANAPRGYAFAAFKINGRSLALYGLHLKSNLGNSLENTSKREDAVQQLMAHIAVEEAQSGKFDHIVIAGDFNTDDPDSPFAQAKGERTFAKLTDGGFFWTFSGVGHENRITCPGNGRYPDASFDHIFTRGLGNPISRVIKASGSDHYPVLVDISH